MISGYQPAGTDSNCLTNPPNTGSGGSRAECAVCRARQARILALEDRITQLEDALEADIMHPPPDWVLSPAQADLARRLAKGPASSPALLGLLDARFPTSEGRTYRTLQVQLCKLRKKLSAFGWSLSNISMNYGTYRIHPDQLDDFCAAMRGEGSHIYTPTAKPKEKSDG